MSERASQTGTNDAGQAAVVNRPSRDEVQDLRRERDEARQLLATLVAALKRATFRHAQINRPRLRSRSSPIRVTAAVA